MYITEFNLKKTLKKIDAKKYEKVDTNFLEDLTFLTKSEKKELFLFSLATKDLEAFSELIFKKGMPEEGGNNWTRPVYHAYQDCQFLNTRLTRTMIPSTLPGIIKESEFLQWLNENDHLLKAGRYDVFKFRYREKFGVEPDMDEFDKEAVQLSKKEPIDQVETKINTLVSKVKNIIKEDSMSFVTRFELEIRVPLMRLLRKYFVMKNNSELNYERHLLDQLGFSPCVCCK